MGADSPDPADPPRRSPLDDLRQRLARLPATHPSGSGYDKALTSAWRGDGPAAGPAAEGDAAGGAGLGAERGEGAAAGAGVTAAPDLAAGAAPGTGDAPVGVGGRAGKRAGPDLATLQRLDRLARALWPDGHGGPARVRPRAAEIRGPGGPGRRAGRELYRPWFCSGDPYQPWFNQGPGDRWY